jgi:hypothetical protein
VFRVFMLLSGFALLLWSCGPDKPQSCPGNDPKFEVLLRLSERPLPEDTVVQVTYAGSAKESYRLSQPKAKLEVTFCKPVNADGTPLGPPPLISPPEGAAGAGGAAAGVVAEEVPGSVPALYCELFTSNYTELEVSSAAFTTAHFELTQSKEECTLKKELLLDNPDAG